MRTGWHAQLVGGGLKLFELSAMRRRRRRLTRVLCRQRSVELCTGADRPVEDRVINVCGTECCVSPDRLSDPSGHSQRHPDVGLWLPGAAVPAPSSHCSNTARSRSKAPASGSVPICTSVPPPTVPRRFVRPVHSRMARRRTRYLALTCAVPLNAQCSSRCASPVRPSGSSAAPTSA